MKYDALYMALAARVAMESHCPRTKVGCIAVAESGIIAPGFNGHASGGPNDWEWKEGGDPEVVHAELNSLGKMMEQGISTKGATLYLTLSPCLECAKLIVRSKVKRVVYAEEYRNIDGLGYLLKYGVNVDKFD